MELNLVGEGATTDAKRPGQSEVCQLDASADVDEQVLRLEVSVNDAVTVTVGDAVQQLEQITLFNAHVT